jgi:hypothetical protein
MWVGLGSEGVLGGGRFGMVSVWFGGGLPSITNKEGPDLVAALVVSSAGRKITSRAGSGWSRMQPTFPRLSTWIRFVGRLVIPPRDELDERDVDEVMVEVRVSEGMSPLCGRGLRAVGCSGGTPPVDEPRVRWSDRLSREKDARGPRTGA